MKNLWNFLPSVPPDPAIGLDLWRGFRQEIIGWLLVSVLVTVVAIVGIYYWASRKLTIRVPSDPFRPYTPMRWLWLSVLPGIVTAVVYVILFPEARVSAVGAAVIAGITTALVSYVIAQTAIWMPGITPLKFLYHPRWPWRILRRRAA